jgi:hypothetical protein
VEVDPAFDDREDDHHLDAGTARARGEALEVVLAFDLGGADACESAPSFSTHSHFAHNEFRYEGVQSNGSQRCCHTVLHTLWTIGVLMMQAFCMMEAPLLIIVSSISTDTSVTPKAHAIHGFTLVQGATLCTI